MSQKCRNLKDTNVAIDDTNVGFKLYQDDNGLELIYVVNIPSEYKEKYYEALAYILSFSVAIFFVNLLFSVVVGQISRYSLYSRSLRKVGNFSFESVKVPSLLRTLGLYEFKELNKALSVMLGGLQNFSKFLPMNIVPFIVKRDKIYQKMLRSNASVFFCDLRGFTSLSETISSRELIGLLDYFFLIVHEQIEENDGIVDSYIGDAVMGIFVKQNEHERLSVNCALSIIEVFKNSRYSDVHETVIEDDGSDEGIVDNIVDREIEVNIGINSGELLVGTLGCKYRVQFTCVGDVVNVAARLEGMCGVHGQSILFGNPKPPLRMRPGFKKNLLEWVKGRTRSYGKVRVRNFNTSWKGLAFCALVHSIDESLFNFDELTPDDPTKNLALAFDTAEKELNVEPLLEPCDITDFQRPDDMIVMMYILEFYKKFGARKSPQKKVEKVKKGHVELVSQEEVNEMVRKKEEERRRKSEAKKKEGVEKKKEGVEKTNEVEEKKKEEERKKKEVEKKKKDELEKKKKVELEKKKKKEEMERKKKLEEKRKKEEKERKEREKKRKAEEERKRKERERKRKEEEEKRRKEEEEEKKKHEEEERKRELERKKKKEEEERKRKELEKKKKQLEEKLKREEKEKKLKEEEKKMEVEKLKKEKEEERIRIEKEKQKELEKKKKEEKTVIESVKKEGNRDSLAELDEKFSNFSSEIDEMIENIGVDDGKNEDSGRRDVLRKEGEDELRKLEEELRKMKEAEEEEEKNEKERKIALQKRIKERNERRKKEREERDRKLKEEDKERKQKEEERRKNEDEEIKKREEEEKKKLVVASSPTKSEGGESKTTEKVGSGNVETKEEVEGEEEGEEEEEELDEFNNICQKRLQDSEHEEDKYREELFNNASYKDIFHKYSFSSNIEVTVKELEGHLQNGKTKGYPVVQLADLYLLRNEFGKSLNLLKNHATTKPVLLKLGDMYFKLFENKNVEFLKVAMKYLGKHDRSIKKKFGKNHKKNPNLKKETIYNTMVQENLIPSNSEVDKVLTTQSKYLMESMKYLQIAEGMIRVEQMELKKLNKGWSKEEKEKKEDIDNVKGDEDINDYSLIDTKILIFLGKTYDQLNIFAQAHEIWKSLLLHLEKTWAKRTPYLISFYTSSYLKSLKSAQVPEKFQKELEELMKNKFVSHTSLIYSEFAKLKKGKMKKMYLKKSEFYKYIPHYCNSIEYTDVNYKTYYQKVSNLRKVNTTLLKNYIKAIGKNIKGESPEDSKIRKRTILEFMVCYLHYASLALPQKGESIKKGKLKEIKKKFSIIFNYLTLRLSVQNDYHVCYLLFNFLKYVKNFYVTRNVIRVLLLASKEKEVIKKKLYYQIVKLLPKDCEELFLVQALLELGVEGTLYHFKQALKHSRNEYLRCQACIGIQSMTCDQNNEKGTKESSELFGEIIQNAETRPKVKMYSYACQYVLKSDEENIVKVFDVMGENDCRLFDLDLVNHLQDHVNNIEKYVLNKKLLKLIQKKKKIKERSMSETKTYYRKSFIIRNLKNK